MFLYTICQTIEDQVVSRLCITPGPFDTEHIAMAVGFDPYDVSATYTVSHDEVSDEVSFQYGLKLSEIVLCEEEAEEIYNERFSKSIWVEETA